MKPTSYALAVRSTCLTCLPARAKAEMGGHTSENLLLLPLFSSYSPSPLKWKGVSFFLPFPFAFNITLDYTLLTLRITFPFPLSLWLKYGQVRRERNDDRNLGGISK